MLPIRWDPIHDINTLQREFDDMVRRVFGTTRDTGGNLKMGVPAINTFVKDNLFHLQAELPGVDTEKLDVRIDGNELVIHGERRVQEKVEDADYLLHETHFSSFDRRLSLPQGVNADQAHASYKDGLLEVTMPITKKAIGGRKVQIEGLKTGKKSKEIH